MLNSKFALLPLANAVVGESTRRGYESQRATSESALDSQEAGLEISYFYNRVALGPKLYSVSLILWISLAFPTKQGLK